MKSRQCNLPLRIYSKQLWGTFELESAMGKNSAYEGFGHKVSAVTLSYRFAKWALNSGSKKVRNH
ncbi:hypothetical protein EAY21_28210 [Vibrio anguillarum]|nr:hypothetical protein [Vibrio anguillarum]